MEHSVARHDHCLTPSADADLCEWDSSQWAGIIVELNSQSQVDLHWGNWNGISDVQMVKRSDGFWQATISVPSGATTINMAFNNDSGTWDNNNGNSYNINV